MCIALCTHIIDLAYYFVVTNQRCEYFSPPGSISENKEAPRDEVALYTLKTPGSDLTRKRVRGGQTHFGVRPTRNPGQTDPESESDWPGIRSQKDILDSDSGNFYPDSRSVWPRNGSGSMGPFSGSNLAREFLECTLCRCCTAIGHIKTCICHTWSFRCMSVQPFLHEQWILWQVKRVCL